MKDQFVLRKATIDDIELILTFIRELADYERLSGVVSADLNILKKNLFGEKSYAEVLLAYEGSEAIGFALYFFNFSTFLGKPGLYLEDIYIRPAFRNRGFGKIILARLAATAKVNDCGRMEWSVLNWNEPSIHFYKKLGAIPMDDWTVFRLEGRAMESLASKASGV
jgi:GNAT superfamily N-acetyltransferase